MVQGLRLKLKLLLLKVTTHVGSDIYNGTIKMIINQRHKRKVDKWKGPT